MFEVTIDTTHFLWSEIIKIPKTQYKTKPISKRVWHLSKYGKKPRTRKKNRNRLMKNIWGR